MAACGGAIITSLRNNVVNVGSSVSMHCVTNTSHGVSWIVGESTPPRREIETPNSFSSNRHDLLIASTKLTDAGRYTCTDMETRMNSTAELIVIGEWKDKSLFLSSVENRLSNYVGLNLNSCKIASRTELKSDATVASICAVNAAVAAIKNVQANVHKIPPYF